MALAMASGAADRASAVPTSFSGMMNNLAASAQFDVSGNNLIVTLRNTSTSDVMVPADILTALFFDINGPTVGLVPISALLPMGTTVLFPPVMPHPSNVGGEWAFQTGLVGAPEGAQYGIGSAGFDLFGPGDRFDKSQNLQGPTSPNGMEYGITSPADDPGTGNAAVKGPNAFIQSEVVFTFGGLPDGFDPALLIKNVVFQYGTSLDEPHFPEPSTLLLALLAVPLVARRRRTR